MVINRVNHNRAFQRSVAVGLSHFTIDTGPHYQKCKKRCPPPDVTNNSAAHKPVLPDLHLTTFRITPRQSSPRYSDSLQKLLNTMGNRKLDLYRSVTSELCTEREQGLKKADQNSKWAHDIFWGTRSLLFQGYRNFFPWGKNRQLSEPYHSSPSNTKVKNAWGYTSTPPCALTSWRRNYFFNFSTCCI